MDYAKLRKDSLLNNTESLKAWDLAWYECFVAFEYNRRNRRNASENTVATIGKNNFLFSDASEEGNDKEIIVPKDVLQQIAAVKHQMTEFQKLLELKQKISAENKELEKKCEEEAERKKKVETYLNSRTTEQEEKINQISTHFKSIDNKNRELKNLIVSYRDSEEKRKKEYDSIIAEIRALRSLNRAENPPPKNVHRPEFRQRNSVSTLRPITSTDKLFNAVSLMLLADDKDISRTAGASCSNLSQLSLTRNNSSMMSMSASTRKTKSFRNLNGNENWGLDSKKGSNATFATFNKSDLGKGADSFFLKNISSSKGGFLPTIADTLNENEPKKLDKNLIVCNAA